MLQIILLLEKCYSDGQKTQKYIIDQKWEIRKYKVFLLTQQLFCGGPEI